MEDIETILGPVGLEEGTPEIEVLRQELRNAKAEVVALTAELAEKDEIIAEQAERLLARDDRMEW